jgi:hypothetical protein
VQALVLVLALAALAVAQQARARARAQLGRIWKIRCFGVHQRRAMKRTTLKVRIRSGKGCSIKANGAGRRSEGGRLRHYFS